MPITSLAPSIGTSSTGRQSAVMPKRRRSKACSRASSQAARNAGVAVVTVERAERRSRGIVRHDRRPQPLHAAALLVDEDRRMRAADAVAQAGDQIGDFRGLADVAGKQDEAPWPLVAVEVDLVVRQGFPGAAEDDGF